MEATTTRMGHGGPARSTGSDLAIETRGLTKRYKEVLAVDSLDLFVRPGEVYGFLGRNGAGKTTTIRMLVGLIRPTCGSAMIFGEDVALERRKAAVEVGSIVESATSYPNLTVRENLEIQRSLTGSSREDLDRSIELLGLKELGNRRAGRLSLGNKQRLALARAVLPRPRLLILDEPANALDPAGIVDIRHFLRRLADEEGVTVFVSSHILAEVSQLADRIGIIHCGRLVEEIASGDTRTVQHLELVVSDVERAAGLLREHLPLSEIAVRDNKKIEIAGEDIEPSRVARVVVEAGIELEALRPAHEDLEARFLRLTGGEG